jgi:hypothetical protein
MPIELVQREREGSGGAQGDRATPVRPRSSTLRVVVSALFLAGSVSTAALVWIRFLNPQVFAPVVQSTASATASAASSPGAGPGTGPAVEEPKWAPVIAEAQRLFTSGDPATALKKLQDASLLGPAATAVAKVYTEQIKFITKEATGPCKPVSFARPRVATERRAERPAVRATPKGTLVTWTDDHVQKDHDHVYGVLLNETGKAIGPIRDLTPEASDAQRPVLTAVSATADRTVLLYWDKSGRDAGVRARFLDADGRIDTNNGESHLIGAARPGDYWPSIDRGPKGFFVVWQDDRDKEKEYDVFVRELSNDLNTSGPETRLTDYHASAKSKGVAPKVRYPSVAVAANMLVVAYRLEKDKDQKVIMRLRVPLADLAKNGLEESKDPNRESREFGDAKAVNPDKAPVDAPAIACGTEGCFVVWHNDQGGASVALIDPNVGRVVWHNKFSDKGGRPSLAVSEGQVALAFYEKGMMRMAFLSRDGVSASSPLVRILDGANPRPTLAPGAAKGEWAVAWQDSDLPKGNPEIYAARVLCR